jgi:hypothetical protein
MGIAMLRFSLSALRPRRPGRLLAAAAIVLAGGALPAFAAVPRLVQDEIDPVSLAPFGIASGTAEEYVSVQGNPFAAPGFADAVTRHMTEDFGGGRARFVPTGANAAQAHYALAFNPAHGLLPDALCSGNPVATEPARGPIVVRAATCLDGHAQSAVTGYLDHASGPDDPGFAGLVRDLTQRLMAL